MTLNRKFRFQVDGIDKVEAEGDAAYLHLPAFPYDQPDGCVHDTVCLDQLLEFGRPGMINLDFDKAGNLIGIEILRLSVSDPIPSS